ncbi:MAG: Rpn family recombination-promoting nuclease/putative transposase [Eubacteriaceae bacterium]|nr:Rpn family recombination-promoting nuclease/putative transposase [Eubacteriaceae bacterium]
MNRIILYIVAKLKYKFKSDILFKMLLTRNPGLLKSLVACSLGLQEDSIEEIVVVNPEILPGLIESKFCRLDINMVVDGQHIDIELQVADEGNFKERAMFYISKMLVEALKSGSDYIGAPHCILICILDFEQFAAKEIHSEFAWLEKKRFELLSDKMAMHFYEMGKLPEAIDLADGMQVWLKILRIENEQELAELENIRNEVDIVDKALDGYKKITASTEYRELERMREKLNHHRLEGGGFRCCGWKPPKAP